MNRYHHLLPRIGAAQADVTPELPDWIVGMGRTFVAHDGTPYEWTGRDKPASSVHDPLTMQALYIESDGPQALLLTADLLYPIAAAQVAEAASHAADVPLESVFYAATHNHNGPVESERYIQLLVERASECAVQAKEQASPAVTEYGWDTYDRIIYDRSEPWGPVDGRVDAVRFSDAATRRPIALILSYGCHPCSFDYGWNEVTADYPGAARRHAQAMMGQAAPVLFLTGCAANVQMIGVRRFEIPRMYLNTPKSDFECVERLGRIIAERAVAALEKNGQTVATDSLSVWRETFGVPIAFEVTEEELRERRAGLPTLVRKTAGPAIPPWEKTRERVFGEMLDEALELVLLRNPRRLIETGFLVCGDLAIVATPLELTWQMGARVRQRSPFPVTITGTTVFGYGGYLAESRCYAQPREAWNYEAIGLAGLTGWVYQPRAPEAYLAAVTERLAEARTATAAASGEQRE